MDQCSRCSVKGNLVKCEAVECGFHDLWYVHALIERIKELEIKNRKLVTVEALVNQLKELDEPVQKKPNVIESKIGKYQSERYIGTVPNDECGWEFIDRIKNSGAEVRLRGRHSNRKAAMAAVGLTPNYCNDIPVRLSERIAIYTR
jgi:hypothetical protein